MLPQFVKLIDKRKRRIIIYSYIITLLTVFITQSVEMVNVTSLAPLNTNIISIALILFNALIVAYVFNDFKNIDTKLLSQTCRVFKIFLLVVLGLIFIFEIFLKYSEISQLTWSEVLDELVTLSPYLMLCLMMIGLITLYRFILIRLASEDELFSWKTIFIFLVIECISASYIYFVTNDEQSSIRENQIANQESIGNKTYAVADYLQAIDPEFYRLINSYQVQYNEPLYQGYNGFSIANPYLVLSSQDVSWMLDNHVENSLSISTTDYMLTTALSAKYYFTPDYEVPLPGYQYFDRIEGITIYKNNYFIPVGSSSPYYILKSEFEKLNQIQQKYVFLKCIILEDETLAKRYNLKSLDVSTLPEEPGEIQYFEAALLRQDFGVKDVEYSQNEVNHRYVTSSPVLLTYTIPYNEGWRAYVNGKEVPIYEVNNGFIGIGLLEDGECEIQLTYRSPGFNLGCVISTTTYLIITISFYYNYKKRKKIASN